MIAIIHADIVLENETLSDGIMLIDKDRIVSFGKFADVKIPENAEIIDANRNYVGPGFVDIHVHGGGGYMFYDDPAGAADYFLKHGETTVLATLYYDLTKQQFYDAVIRIKNVMKNDFGKSISGFYMEGPYLNPQYGASPEKNHWKGTINPDDYADIVDCAGKDTKIWAVAPEREGIETFVKKVKSVNPNTVISIAHSEATPTEVERLKKYGIILQTHSTNATGTVNSIKGTRKCGPDEVCFLDDNMYAEVICDSLGMHIEKYMLKLLLKIKGKDKLVLITDSFVSAEESPPEFSHITDLSFDASGNLSGSKLTMNMALKNMITHTGISICDGFLMASRNPARVIGLDDEIGSIKIGKRADIVILNKEFEVKKVIFGGKVIC